MHCAIIEYVPVHRKIPTEEVAGNKNAAAERSHDFIIRRCARGGRERYANFYEVGHQVGLLLPPPFRLWHHHQTTSLRRVKIQNWRPPTDSGRILVPSYAQHITNYVLANASPPQTVGGHSDRDFATFFGGGESEIIIVQRAWAGRTRPIAGSYQKAPTYLLQGPWAH